MSINTDDTSTQKNEENINQLAKEISSGQKMWLNLQPVAKNIERITQYVEKVCALDAKKKPADQRPLILNIFSLRMDFINKAIVSYAIAHPKQPPLSFSQMTPTEQDRLSTLIGALTTLSTLPGSQGEPEHAEIIISFNRIHLASIVAQTEEKTLRDMMKRSMKDQTLSLKHLGLMSLGIRYLNTLNRGQQPCAPFMHLFRAYTAFIKEKSFADAKHDRRDRTKVRLLESIHHGVKRYQYNARVRLHQSLWLAFFMLLGILSIGAINIGTLFALKLLSPTALHTLLSHLPMIDVHILFYALLAIPPMIGAILGFGIFKRVQITLPVAPSRIKGISSKDFNSKKQTQKEPTHPDSSPSPQPLETSSTPS